MPHLARTNDGWLATSYADVCAVLEAPELGVPPAPPNPQIGTSAWLRASVSRFSNGAEHAERRAIVTALLGQVDPDTVRREAQRRAIAGDDHRRVVSASLAAALGADDPDTVADAIIDCAGAYFPGADDDAISRADEATARLLTLLGDGDGDGDGDDVLDVVVARIAILVQACDATAQLIDATVQGSNTPPVRVMRRVALRDVTIAGERIRRGETVVCDLVQAGRETAEQLTFGHGPRACPGVEHALAAVDGVVAAIRRE